MPYNDVTYTPTVWQNEVTLIDGQKLNKIESALVNLEYAESLRFGTLRTSVLPLATTNPSDVFSISAIGAVQLSNTYTPGGVANINQTKYAATPYAVSQAYANSAAIDTKVPSARIARESVIAQGLKESVSIEFVGAQASSAKKYLQTSGDAISFDLAIKDDAHNHTIKSINAIASTQAKGFVKLAQDFDTIVISAHSDTVPTAKLFKDEIQKSNLAIKTEKDRIDLTISEVGNIKSLAPALDTTPLGIGVKSGKDAKTWVDSFKASGGKLETMETSISENSKAIGELKSSTGVILLKFNNYLTTADYIAAQEELISNYDKKIFDLEQRVLEIERFLGQK